MLTDIWNIDDRTTAFTFEEPGSLASYLNDHQLVQHAIVLPAASIGPRVGLADKKFRMVDFRRCTFHEITYRDCHFIDCIFLAAAFVECRFHNCRFIDCNVWRITFGDVYLDPGCLRFGNRFRDEFPNIPLGMYDSLYPILRANERLEHLIRGDVERRRWKRRQTYLEAKREKRVRLWWQYAWSWIADCVSRYGYAPGRFLIFSIAIFMLVVVPVHLWWPQLGLYPAGQRAAATAGFGATLFYCASLFTTMGLFDLTPATGLGRLISILFAVMGITWSGMFTAILVRRFLR